jgi:mono/diheme cytochrome c family protein/uncharacterized membrane protein
MSVARLLLPFALLACGPALASDTPVAVALLGRLHFPLLHFPIVLLLVSLLVELGLRRRLPNDARRSLLRTLTTLAAISAVLTVVSGLAYAQGEDFEGATADAFNVHRAGGIAIAVVAVVVAAAVRSSGGFARATIPLLTMASLGVVVVGHEGGELVHGAGFYTRPLRAPPVATKGPRALYDASHADDDDTPARASDGDDGADTVATRDRHPEGVVPATPDFAIHIGPVFQRSCVKCHGPDKRKGGLRLDAKRFAIKGGETGPTAIVAGHADTSLVYIMSAHAPDDEDVMPTKGKLLSLSELETLKRWIDQGAAWPDAH